MHWIIGKILDCTSITNWKLEITLYWKYVLIHLDPFILIYPRLLWSWSSEATEGDFSTEQQWNTKLQRLPYIHNFPQPQNIVIKIIIIFFYILVAASSLCHPCQRMVQVALWNFHFNIFLLLFFDICNNFVILNIKPEYFM